MIQLTRTVEDPEGLHARPVAAIASCALRHESSVVVSCARGEAGADDLMGLMELGARAGDELTFCVEGPDERDTADALLDISL